MSQDGKQKNKKQNVNRADHADNATKAGGKKTKRDTDFKVSESEWARRTLCRDESCIGVIGKDGRCKECGLEFGSGWTPSEPGDSPQSDSAVNGSQEMEDSEPQIADDDGIDDDLYGESDQTDVDHDWSKRTLCRDESCIGVIGKDGRCKECSLPYKK